MNNRRMIPRPAVVSALLLSLAVGYRAAANEFHLFLDPSRTAEFGVGLVALPDLDASAALHMTGTLSGSVEGSDVHSLMATLDAKFVLDLGEASVECGPLAIFTDEAGAWLVADLGGWGGPMFSLADADAQIMGSGAFVLYGELTFHPDFVENITYPNSAPIDEATRAIGELVLVSRGMESHDAIPPQQGGVAGGPEIGPDVIVGNIHQTWKWGQANGVSAFSVGTVSCNIGDVWLEWHQETPEHPVIATNLYRLKDDRFEQIAQSWVKHGYFALSETYCSGPGQCDGDGSGNHLGVGCSDPYSATTNGTQNNLGPRGQINATTGQFPFPVNPAPPAAPPTVGRRLQVLNTDINPGQNAGALYFATAQYVNNDEPAWGTDYNNASYRRIFITGTADSGNYGITLNGNHPTAQVATAIDAWAANAAGVVIDEIIVPGDGLIRIGSWAGPVDGDTWRYEYMIENINSDRAVGSFSVSLPADGPASNPYFHFAPYHSGEVISNDPWTVDNQPGAITWSTVDFATNSNANAVRFATGYTFAFESPLGPVLSPVTLGLFKPGSPGEIELNALTPASPFSLSGLAVSGPTVVNEGSVTAYTAMASFVSLPDEDVTNEATWSVSPPSAGSINANGVFTAAALLNVGDVNATITASYTDGSDTVEDSINVLVQDQITIVGSNPPSGAIDARQPHNPDGSNVTGILTFTIFSDGRAGGVEADDFTVQQIGGVSPPQVQAVALLDLDEILVILDQPLEPRTRFILTHTESNSSIEYGYLPGDVSADEVSAATDILALIDGLNGIITLPIYSSDIDRSGAPGAPDVLRLVDLLNGAGEYDVYLGATLP